MQRVNLVEASKWITPSYEKNKEQMDNLLKWAESAGCICAETGQRFKHDKRQGVTALATEAKRVTRKVKKADESAA
jgi:hypothetical protein